jgi:hypothetical protein
VTLTLDIASPIGRILLFRTQYDPVTETLTLWERCSGEVSDTVDTGDRPDSSGFQIIRPADNATGGRYNAEKHWFEHLHYCESRTDPENDTTVDYFVVRYDLQACQNPQTRTYRQVHVVS